MIPVKYKKTGDVALTADTQALIEEKLKVVTKLLDADDTTALAEVEIEELKERRGGFRIEINLSSKGQVYRSEAKRPTVRIALDAAMEDLRRELRRNKTKNIDFARGVSRAAKDWLRGFGKS